MMGGGKGNKPKAQDPNRTANASLYMCWDAPPPAYRGPAMRRNLEWIWRREESALPCCRAVPYDWRARPFSSLYARCSAQNR